MPRRPTERQLKVLWNIQQAEEGQPMFVNSGDAEECEDLGWVEAQPGGRYRLTDEGRRILREYPEGKS
jgi:hypothetical protein